VKVMKRAVLVIVSALALVGLLIADIAWPKASTADEIPAAAPAAQAGATPEAAANSVPKEATAETSDSASQGTTAEEAPAQNMPGSVEDTLDQLDEPAAAGSASSAGAFGGEKESKGEAASENEDAPAADESGVR
jgi:hypothetical protein